MCRGYITRGKIYHEGTEVIGSGYQEAQTKESGVSAFKRDANELGTPFVEVDRTVTEYVRDHGDGCVKEMFSRQIQSDGVVTAIFPFKRLAHRFLVRPDLDPAKEKRANENVRRRLQEFKLRVSATVDRTNARAVSKMEHYIAALDAQLEICAKTDEFIDKLNTLIPRNRPELK